MISLLAQLVRSSQSVCWLVKSVSALPRMSEMTETEPRFIFVCTQFGAEKVCKKQLMQNYPTLRFAFSRPGFLTFKIDENAKWNDRFHLANIFVRTAGFGGPRCNRDPNALTAQIRGSIDAFTGSHIHIWSCDLQISGSRTADPSNPFYHPGTSPLLPQLIQEVEAIAKTHPERSFHINKLASIDERVLDIILVDDNNVLFGWHSVTSNSDRWPGGIPDIVTPDEMVSRAYLKIVEGIEWSRMPIRKGDWCAEIGAAPGGASQALLDCSAKVIGVDPAEIDPRVAKHPNFRHIRSRGSEVKCREFRNVRWLFVDTNVAPKHTLDTVERIVTNDAVRVRGMLLTLKLTDLKLSEELPQYFERVKSWGFQFVKARQLAYNRREFCLAAFRNKATIRF